MSQLVGLPAAEDEGEQDGQGLRDRRVRWKRRSAPSSPSGCASSGCTWG